mmetsp:Transcript_38313/g.58170  ORF Transcript_38313/g.58170 Transcript_38313/m.58170 type:complete len:225 (-) Transcript_38313:455-1129(-)
MVTGNRTKEEEVLKKRKDNKKEASKQPQLFHIPPLLLLLLLLFFLFTSPTNAMRIVVQRVKSASVTVDSQKVSSIGPGLLALVGLHEHDTEEDLTYCCRKLLAAKLWENENGASWRHGVKQKSYDLLCVSQFTLYGSVANKKHCPDYKSSMKNEPAKIMYSKFLDMCKTNYEEEKVHDGVFGAMMDVELVNDGPVTIVIESGPSGVPPPPPPVSSDDGNKKKEG